MKKNILVFNLILIIIFSGYSEKWVGRVAVTTKRDGEKTFSGQAYDSNSLTAACNGFKIGAKVNIIGVVSKKMIEVTINDRVDEDSEYFMVISKKAAEELGINDSTELVVVEADFSDVNSDERLAVNGIISEEEMDKEILKEFPDTNWPDIIKEEKDEIVDKDELKEYPDIDKKEDIPSKEKYYSNLDRDDVNDYLYVETDKDIPQKEMENIPKYSKKFDKIDYDIYDFEGYYVDKDTVVETKDNPLVEKELMPDKEKKKDEINLDIENEFFALKEEKIDLEVKKDIPEKDKLDYPSKDKIAEEKLDKDTPNDYKYQETTVVEDKDEKIYWNTKLLANKIYVRFSTSLDKNEGERRFKLFKKVFPNVIGIKSNGKYILFVGPVEENDIDNTLESIRKYGFIDAYIIKNK